jgi:hypothetical protein
VFYKKGRQVWNKYNHLFPESVRQFVISKYQTHKNDKLKREGELFGAGLEVESSNNTLNNSATDDRLKDKKRTDSNSRVNDGMRDYPTTRPHLAFDYLSGLVRWLSTSDYKVMSYNDLSGRFKHGEEGDEFQRWIVESTESNEKAVLLQYDVDARADITANLLKTHIEYKVPANVMVFKEKIFDWKLKREGIIEVDETYNLDYKILQAFEKMGGVVGYHCNAFDRSGGDMEKAIEIFHEDIKELRKYFNIKFFSMHGGHVTKEGKCNGNMAITPYLKELGLTWVHNGHSVYFHSNWADGSASNPNYRKESSDTLDFILSTKIGERTRLLFHPQYYNDETNTHFDFPILQDQQWVFDTRAIVESDGHFDGEKYWANRHNEASQQIAEFDTLFNSEKIEQPVFINGMSRSGTTLLVSMFDAHPDGAMAYESYPRYLYVPSDNGVLTTEEYIYTYQSLINYPDNEAFNLLSRPPLVNLMRFAAVTNWTGMTTQQIGQLLRAYLTKHHRVADVQEALKIVAASARYKVRQQNATFWGTKCQGNFEDYFALWPEARMVYIMRNGLDILASQKTNGSFNPDAKQLGKNWRTQYERYMRVKEANPNQNMSFVRYEELVSTPEITTQKLCNDMGIEYHPQMISQHEVKSTLAENPRGQLSAKRVQQPIDNASMNKWRKVLSEEDVKNFLSGSGGIELFEKNGFEWEF